MDETALFIASLHPYDSLPKDELARVAAAFLRRDWPEGAVVYRFGDRLGGLYLIEDAGV